MQKDNINEEQQDNANPSVVKSSKRGTKICQAEETIYRQWFETRTDVRSGSANQLRQMSHSKHGLMFDLFASFPRELRSFSKSSEGKDILCQSMQKLKKTRFEIAMVASSKPLTITDDDE